MKIKTSKYINQNDFIIDPIKKAKANVWQIRVIPNDNGVLKLKNNVINKIEAIIMLIKIQNVV